MTVELILILIRFRNMKADIYDVYKPQQKNVVNE